MVAADFQHLCISDFCTWLSIYGRYGIADVLLNGFGNLVCLHIRSLALRQFRQHGMESAGDQHGRFSAVFGVLGALLAYTMLQRGAVPPKS